ncbi:MAG: hypothetical protein LUG65_04945 [Clostridiales bacterium]|nr:hypothetical protein [Clostridiales bacterium]
MLLYDTADTIAGRPRKCTPLTDEQYAQRCEAFNALVDEYMRRVRLAMGSRDARKLRKSVMGFIDRNAFTDVSFETWKLMLEAILPTTCHLMIEGKIRFTPKKYKKGWTAEELDRMIDICGVSESGRYYVFKTAGLPCEKPESMFRHERESAAITATGA